jgi:hypothetical protein
MEGSRPALFMKVRSEAVQTGMDAKRATEGPAGVLASTSRRPNERPQFMQFINWDRSRHARIRRRSRSFLNNAG